MAADSIDTAQLTPNEELRFILAVNDCVTVQVSEGAATSFGWAIPPRAPVTFRDQPFPVSTAGGCQVAFSGTYRSYYTAPYEVPGIVGAVLRAAQTAPPTVFVVGAAGAGKTSLCKLLVNGLLAHLPQRAHYYVNADPAQAPFCPQGCVGALPVTAPADNYGFPFTDPLCFFFAETALEEKRQALYDDQLAELGARLQGRRKLAPDGGAVVDFPAVTSRCIQDSLEHAINVFHATHIVAVADTRLAVSLRRKFTRQKFERMGPLPGAVPLEAALATVNSANTRRYFYGDPDHPLNPTTHMVAKDALKLHSLGPLNLLGRGLQPGAMPTTDPKVATPLSFSRMLATTIMAVIKDSDKAGYWKQNVLGFLHVLGPETEDRKFPVLMPAHGDLPSRTVLASPIFWQDK
jgi:hypothetical protein